MRPSAALRSLETVSPFRRERAWTLIAWRLAEITDYYQAVDHVLEADGKRPIPGCRGSTRYYDRVCRQLRVWHCTLCSMRFNTVREAPARADTLKPSTRHISN